MTTTTTPGADAAAVAKHLKLADTFFRDSLDAALLEAEAERRLRRCHPSRDPVGWELLWAAKKQFGYTADHSWERSRISRDRAAWAAA